MRDQITINVIQDPAFDLNVEEQDQNVYLNPISLNQGIINHSVTHASGGSDELTHNSLGGLQGGSSNQFYHLNSGQYANLTTGAVVRPNETGVFVTKSETGAFYPVSNPSGFITGVDLSAYVTGDVIRPNETGAFYPASNPSGFITGVDLSAYVTGSVVRPSETGNFITNSQTGQFYSSSNPSGFITGVDLSAYVTGDVVRPSETGNFITSSQTGAFYPVSNPSGFITGAVVRPSETGSFLTTGAADVRYVGLTGNQDISGLKDFQTRPTVLDTPVLISGDAVDTIHLYGKNDESFILNKGQPVFISSANGANPLISLASNTGERTSSKTLGLMAQSIAPNEFGYIITEGLLEGFDTSSGVAGDPMWLGPTGNIIYGTGNKPYGNNHLVSLGIVLRSQSNNGKVYVKVQNGFEIDELHKVYAKNPQDKYSLLYDSASGAWISRQIGTGDVSGIDSYYLNSNPSGFALTVDPVRTTLTGNGATSIYAVSGASGLVNPSALIVAIDGALQEPVEDYTVASGNITFTSPLASGSKAVVISPTNSLQVSQMIPADGSVTSSKLDANITIAGQLQAPNQVLVDNNSVMTKASYQDFGYKWKDWYVAGNSNYGVGFNNSTSNQIFNWTNSSQPSHPFYLEGDIASLNFSNRIIKIQFTLRSGAASITGTGSACWFVIGETYNLAAGSIGTPSKKGFGIKLTSTGISLWVHNGTTYTLGTEYAIPSYITMCRDIRLTFQNGQLTGSISGNVIPSVIGGPSGDSATNQHVASWQTQPLGGGSVGSILFVGTQSLTIPS